MLPYMAQTCPQNILSNIKQILAGYLNSKACEYGSATREQCFLWKGQL